MNLKCKYFCPIMRYFRFVFRRSAILNIPNPKIIDKLASLLHNSCPINYIKDCAFEIEYKKFQRIYDNEDMIKLNNRRGATLRIIKEINIQHKGLLDSFKGQPFSETIKSNVRFMFYDIISKFTDANMIDNLLKITIDNYNQETGIVAVSFHALNEAGFNLFKEINEYRSN